MVTPTRRDLLKAGSAGIVGTTLLGVSNPALAASEDDILENHIIGGSNQVKFFEGRDFQNRTWSAPDLSIHQSEVHGIAVTSDNETMYTGDEDNMVVKWDISGDGEAKDEAVQTPMFTDTQTNIPYIENLKLSDDESTLYATVEDGIVGAFSADDLSEEWRVDFRDTTIDAADNDGFNQMKIGDDHMYLATDNGDYVSVNLTDQSTELITESDQATAFALTDDESMMYYFNQNDGFYEYNLETGEDTTTEPIYAPTDASGHVNGMDLDSIEENVFYVNEDEYASFTADENGTENFLQSENSTFGDQKGDIIVTDNDRLFTTMGGDFEQLREADVSDGTEIWTYTHDVDGDNIYKELIESDGQFYAALTDGFMEFDDSNGEPIWFNQNDENSRISSLEIIDKTIISVASDIDVVRAYDLSGEMQWEVEGYDIGINTDVHNDTIIVAEGNGVLSIDANDGSVNWHVDNISSVEDVAISPDGENVYAVDSDEIAYGFDSVDGQQLWDNDLATEHSALNHVEASNDMAYVIGSSDPEVRGLNADDGTQEYVGEILDDSTAATAYDEEEDLIYASIEDNDNSILCINATDGSVLWQEGTNGDAQNVPDLALNDGILYAILHIEPEIYWMDATTDDLTSDERILDVGNPEDVNEFRFSVVPTNLDAGEEDTSDDTSDDDDGGTEEEDTTTTTGTTDDGFLGGETFGIPNMFIGVGSGVVAAGGVGYYIYNEKGEEMYIE